MACGAFIVASLTLVSGVHVYLELFQTEEQL